MEIGYPEICDVLSLNKNLLSFPGLTPDYVIADSLRDEKLIPKFFIYQKHGEIYYHPFHMCNIRTTPYFEIISAYGYGGPISSTSDVNFLTEAINEHKIWCNENNIIVETIRFHPLSKNWQFYHGEAKLLRNTIYVDLQPSNLLSTYIPTARWAIRKALKNGVRFKAVDSDMFLQIFPELYFSRMKEVNAKEFYFFNLDYFTSICRMENAFRALAIHKDEVIGASLFLLQNNVIEYHLSATTIIGKQLRAINFILHEAFLYAQSKKCKFAHLGGGITSDHNDPLFIFKLSFAGKLAEYRIGKYIHDKQIYEELIDQKLLQER